MDLASRGWATTTTTRTTTTATSKYTRRTAAVLTTSTKDYFEPANKYKPRKNQRLPRIARNYRWHESRGTRECAEISVELRNDRYNINGIYKVQGKGNDLCFFFNTWCQHLTDWLLQIFWIRVILNIFFINLAIVAKYQINSYSLFSSALYSFLESLRRDRDLSM